MRKLRVLLAIIMVLNLVIPTSLGYADEVSTGTEAIVKVSDSLPTRNPITVTIEYPEESQFKEYRLDGERRIYEDPFIVERNETIEIYYSITGIGNITQTYTIDNIIRKFNILELQPYDSYELEDKRSYDVFTGYFDVNMTKQSVRAFNSKIEPINGHYDMVYIGNKKKNSKGYSRYGSRPSKIPLANKSNGSSGIEERYSGIDITNKRARQIKEFIDSGQLTLISESIFTESSLRDTKLYNNFRIYYENRSDYPNIHFVNDSKLDDMDIGQQYEYCKKRPLINITDTPKQYENNDGVITYNDGFNLGYRFDIVNRNSKTPMKARLYLDINGDGLFKDYEMVSSTNNILDGEGYAINYIVESTIGLQPWMIELEDLESGVKTKKIGYTALDNEQVTINVLQVYPHNKNTLDIKNRISQSLLVHEGQYEIIVTSMSHKDFNNNQPDLNGVYDMIILGFADAYGYVDIDNPVAVEKLKNFIATGQGVLFTHDILTYDVRDSKTWAVELTREFRDMIGQNIYIKDYFNSDINKDIDLDNLPEEETGDQYIQAGKKAIGYSREAFYRANSGGGFHRVTNTHKMNEGFLTMYPYLLPENLPVAQTHYQYYQLDLEDEDVIPWYTLKGSGYNIDDGRNDYYTYSKGNITYSGTGHKAPNGTPEHKFFINTMLKAVKGANHAPEVEIYDLANNSFISKDKESLEFKFKAKDVDLDDKEVHAKIYIDKNNDSIFTEDELDGTFNGSTVETNQLIDVVLPLSELPSSLTDLKIKVLVYDDQGAEGYDNRAISRINIPLLELDTHSIGLLIGDSGDVNFDISPSNADSSTVYSNVRLSVNYEEGLSVNADSSEGWVTDLPNKALVLTIDDLTPNGDNTWSDITKGFRVGANSSGSHDINYNLTYDVTTSGLTSEAFEQSGSLSVDVKTGRIYVEVYDEKNRAIEKTEVKIDDIKAGETSKTGSFVENNLSSGHYDVEITPPEGYILKVTEEDEHPEKKSVNLSYSTSFKTLTYEVSGDCIDQVDILDAKDQPEAKIVKNGRLLLKVKFKLIRNTKNLKLYLSSDLQNNGITILSVKDSGNTDVTYGFNKYIFTFDQELNKGNYEINVMIDLNDNTLNNSDNKYIKIDKAEIVEPHFEGGDFDEYIINDKLELEVVEYPSLL